MENGTYELTFTYPDSGWRSRPFYQVTDLTNSASPSTLLPWTRMDENILDTRYFDGMILHMEIDTSLTPISQAWTEGSRCNYKVLFTYDDAKANALNWDFELTFTDGIGDTSMSVSRYTQKIPVPFYIYSPTTKQKMKFIITDYNMNGKWDPADDIRILLGTKRGRAPARGTGNYLTSWRFHFITPLDSTAAELIPPAPGDVFKVRMNVPPQPGETYTFFTKEIRIDPKDVKQDLDNITVVPNPYVVAERWEPSSPYLSGRGPMSIHFTHLPKECIIKIFTVQGYLVDTIEHHGETYEGTAEWDVISKDNMQIAAGNYIYHIEAPGIGNKVGRFMIIK